MPNLNQVLKAEILRLAAKQVRVYAAPLKKDITRLKKTAVQLRRAVAQLTTQASVLLDAETRRAQSAPAMSEADLAHFQPRGAAVRKMRKKMRLTQQEFAKLAGTSPVSVGKWEKAGRKAVQLRGASKKALAKLVGVGAAEAKLLLERLAEQKPVVKKPVAKKAKKIKATRKVKRGKATKAKAISKRS